MFKKFSHITLSFLLLTATTGMAVSKHYCGDSLVSTVLFGEAESCCDSGSCCHNESSFYQVDEDFSAPQTVNAPDLQEIAVLGLTILIFNQTPADKHFKTFQNNNSPPPSTVHEILTKNQVFLL
jgi:hypothetical protein